MEERAGKVKQGAEWAQGSPAKEEINTYVKTCFCAPVQPDTWVALPAT